ncbi:hypothetical protein ABVK25_011179 [Lepraria finkii]|uniref:Uncharacterized protein n=1 Tax=Lepraria finkii TaxID=1340010 RepID=A0ABR4AR48_9LECA
MDVDECITDYTKILRTVFNKDKKGCPLNWKGNVKGRLDSNVFAEAFEDIIERKGLSSDTMHDEGGIGGNGDCKVLFYTAAHETKDIVRLRSYAIPGELDDSAPRILKQRVQHLPQPLISSLSISGA